MPLDPSYPIPPSYSTTPFTLPPYTIPPFTVPPPGYTVPPGYTLPPGYSLPPIPSYNNPINLPAGFTEGLATFLMIMACISNFLLCNCYVNRGLKKSRRKPTNNLTPYSSADATCPSINNKKGVLLSFRAKAEHSVPERRLITVPQLKCKS